MSPSIDRAIEFADTRTFLFASLLFQFDSREPCTSENSSSVCPQAEHLFTSDSKRLQSTQSAAGIQSTKGPVPSIHSSKDTIGILRLMGGRASSDRYLTRDQVLIERLSQ